MLVFLAGSLGTIQSQQAFAQNSSPNKVHVIILFKEQPTVQEIKSFNDLKLVKRLNIPNEKDLIISNGGVITKTWNIINAFAADIAQDKINILKHDPMVASVDLDTKGNITDTFADTQIRANLVWNTLDTGQGVKIAILDSGIDTTHQEFTGRIALCHTEIPNTTTCEDDNGHGTHVAGIAAATGVDPNAKGVAPSASLLIDKVIDSSGIGLVSQLISGIDWAVSNNAQIISMSLGNYADANGNIIITQDPNCDTAIPSLTTAISQAYSMNVAVVAASGNWDGAGVVAPGCISKTIAVGAVSSFDTLATFSSQGGAMADHGIVAPGIGIYSAYLNNGYRSLQGTSMATPMVSGVVALMLQKNPTLTPSMIKATLFNTTCTITSTPSCPSIPSTPSNAFGYGRVDALRASTGPIIDTTNTVVSINAVSVNIGAQTNVTATVTDTSRTANPPGTVSWGDGNPPAGGTFSSEICNSSGNNQLVCSVTYTAPNTSGIVILNGTYVPSNSSYATSSGKAQLVITKPLSVSITSPSTVILGTLVNLNSSTTGGLAPFTYAWTMTIPSGSHAKLSNTTVSNPTFTPDVTGNYVVGLSVNDSASNHANASSTTVTALRGTSTRITPNSTGLAIGTPILFHAKITDISSSPTTPRGTVSWSDGGAGGHFSSSTCTLTKASRSASTCSIIYIPPSLTRLVTITGNYSGDTTHASSSGPSALTITLRQTSAVVTPNPSSIVHGNHITYLVTIKDTSTGAKSAPMGKVSWKASLKGGSFSNGTCTLSPISFSQSICKVTYTAPLTAGTVTITGSYGGDSRHAKTSGISNLTVT